MTVQDTCQKMNLLLAASGKWDAACAAWGLEVMDGFVPSDFKRTGIAIPVLAGVCQFRDKRFPILTRTFVPDRFIADRATACAFALAELEKFLAAL